MMEQKLRFCIVAFIALAPLALDAANAANLTILVPLKKGFEEFVRWESASGTPIAANSTITFSGFAIEVFRECMKRLGYNYELKAYGDGITDPSYEALVQKLVSGVTN
jgi:hypothetical protein